MPEGDLGRSYITRRPIVRELAQRFPATLKLALAAMLIAVIRPAVGIWGAVRPGSWGDRVATLGAYLGISFPVYWVGLLLILAFAVSLRWFPPSGYGGALPRAARRHPGDALDCLPGADDPLGDARGAPADLVRTARAKGLPHGR